MKVVVLAAKQCNAVVADEAADAMEAVQTIILHHASLDYVNVF